MNRECGVRVWSAVALGWTILVSSPAAADEVIEFSPDRWQMPNVEVEDHLGRKCIRGFAVLKDVEFENGVIEVDFAVEKDVRGYPGIVFRMQDPGNYEHFYIRPHRAPFYSDALQYTPCSNGISSWQLYSGEGFTAATEIPEGEWVHLKIEVSGSQARVYFGDMETPALVIPELQHGVSRGSIGILAYRNQAAYFSDFRCRANDGLAFDPPPKVERAPGTVMDWELSDTFPMTRMDLEAYPDPELLSSRSWEKVQAKVTGLVDVGRYRARTGPGADGVLARTTLTADRDEVREFTFGYSDAVCIFLNRRLMFFGNSAYQSRDPSFLGIIGWFDSVWLPLRKGDNELLLAVFEGFGGWGLQVRDGDAVFAAAGVEKQWETAKAFRTPESVVYDPDRGVLYVSNYDVYARGPASGSQFVSRLGMDGTVRDLEWVKGLKNPTGMIIRKNRLLVVERGGFVEVDLKSGEIVDRHEAPESRFLNDIAVDGKGRVYLSDSDKDVLWRFADGKFEVWLDEGVDDPNGLLIQGDELFWGNNGDNRLKAADLKTRKTRTVAEFCPGTIDGLKGDSRGNLLLSQWQGRIYRVTPAGAVTKLLDTTTLDVKLADFEYVTGENLVLIPTFYGNRVVAYRVEG